MAELLHSGLARFAEFTPEATALVTDDGLLTYAGLEHKANQLANQLRALGCERGARVCFLIPQSLDAIIAMLGILKADCIYVPLDPESPPPRLAMMLDASEPECVLFVTSTEHRLLEGIALSESRRAPILGNLDRSVEADSLQTAFTGSDIASSSSASVTERNTPDDPAYMLFTSGSTGFRRALC